MSVFSSRLILLTKGDLLTLDKPGSIIGTEKYYELMSRLLNSRTLTAFSLSGSADYIYLRLLSLFTDVLYFFTEDISRFWPIVYCLVLWLDLRQSSILLRSTCPKVLIITE